MLKNILNLKGAQQLSKKEQNDILGGDGLCPNQCGPSAPCIDPNDHCLYLACNGTFGWLCVAEDKGEN